MIFTIKNALGNDFYYKNAIEMIFTIKMHWKWFLLWKCNRNDFYYKNALEMIFTIKMHWKWFLLWKCIGNGFYDKIHCKLFLL